jgi:sterol desaturase/sphingolipid hydroxylase (fatty acid hydroxylase superfamily)
MLDSANLRAAVFRTRLVTFWPYAAAIAIVACVAVFLTFERQIVSDVWSWAVGFVEAKWRRGLLVPGVMALIGTLVLLAIEPLFLAWEKTTLFIVFFRRRVSAVIDLVSTVYFYSPFKVTVEYILTFGLAFAVSRVADAASARFGWVRWELPSEGILGVTVGFVVFYIVSSFIGYWQHRVSHWRWFWYLHRFHHAATDFNILTTFRVNPADAIVDAAVVLPLFFLKAPSDGLFAAFVVANQLLGQLQHSSLPWTFGWLGRWVITAPTNHQVHHSIALEHKDKNFSSCPLWDHMFGTWYDGPNRPSAYGIPDPAHVERPLTQWLIDIWIFYRDVFTALASGVRSVLAPARPPPAVEPVEAPASVSAE